nr:HNH endonuclease [Bacillus cereus]
MNGKGNGCWGLREFDNDSDWDLIDLEEEFSEGKQILRTHLSYERNNKVIRRAKEHFKQQYGGKLFCEICGFDFHKVYGELGKDFIEGHHTIPVSQLKEGEKTKNDKKYAEITIRDKGFKCISTNNLYWLNLPVL